MKVKAIKKSIELQMIQVIRLFNFNTIREPIQEIVAGNPIKATDIKTANDEESPQDLSKVPRKKQRLNMLGRKKVK